MVDTKKLKKMMIDNDVSNVEMQLLLGKSSQSWYNKLNYANTFSIIELHQICNKFECKCEDLLFDSLEEYDYEVERIRNK